MSVASVYLWANGMVMVFDEGGEQMAELQGPADAERVRAIQRRSTATTAWHGFGEDGPCVWR